MDLTYHYDAKRLALHKKEIKKIFFYRICGTGMGACACLLKEGGYEIAGADSAFFPPMSDYLKTTGIKTYLLDDLRDETLKDFDLIVIGNSVPRASEHARRIENLAVPFSSFPDVLGQFILKDKTVIGIAGTHGKTTTTYFLQQILNFLGDDTGYLIGGIMNDQPPARLGQSKFFVIESDEYDSAYFQKISKFRLYQLNHMILTSLEFDHADIYDNVEQIEEEFSVVLGDGIVSVCANIDYPSIKKLRDRHQSIDWIMYGENYVEIIEQDLKGVSFKIKFENNSYQFRTNILGIHNIYNLTSCLLILMKLGKTYQELKDSLLNLKLVKRRQELRGMYKDAFVIDDFAHHPRAVDLTIKAIKDKYPNQKVITVFEPISATARSSVFQNEFTQALKSSDEVILATNPLQTTVKNSNNLDTQKMVEDLKTCIKFANNTQSLEELRQCIDERIRAKDVLLILSNRTCLGLWESDFINEIK